MQTTRHSASPGLFRSTAIAGVLAAAAVLGALAVFARHDHQSIFAADVGPPVGALLHLLLSLGWAFVFVVVAAPLRGLRVLGVAFLTSGAIWVISAHLLPPALQFGNDLYASSPRSAVVHLLVALALAGGMRLAR